MHVESHAPRQLSARGVEVLPKKAGVNADPRAFPRAAVARRTSVLLYFTTCCKH